MVLKSKAMPTADNRYNDLLENPNTPKDIIIEYLRRDGDYTDKLDHVYESVVTAPTCAFI